MKKNLLKSLATCASLLLLAGCGGGSGSMFSALGDAFGSGGGGGLVGGGGASIATVHNPEPATMLLWGAGLVGAALISKKKRK